MLLQVGLASAGWAKFRDKVLGKTQAREKGKAEGMAECTEEVEELETTNDALLKEISRLKAENKDLTTRASTAESAKKAAEGELKSCSMKASAAEEGRSVAQREKNSCLKREDAYKSRIENLEIKLKDDTEDGEGITLLLNQTRANLDQCTANLSAETARCNDLDSRLSEIKKVLLPAEPVQQSDTAPAADETDTREPAGVAANDNSGL